MCGIVGLFLRDPAMEPEFGGMLADMLETMTDRGPDSAGFAVYGSASPASVKITVRAAEGADFETEAAELRVALGCEVKVSSHDTHGVFHVPEAKAAEARAILRARAPDLHVVSAGHRMEIYKEVGLPAAVSKRFGLPGMSGTHGIGHTRMATESAVTTDGAHPFTTALDQCLVHNGSLSNHNAMRRRLTREGIEIETLNDSEVAAGYISWRIREKDGLGQALERSLGELDGFYTFVVGTESGFGVLRDPIACKPAVMAETEQYVAFGSEYRALAALPGIGTARVWEPEPATVYFWERQAA